MQHFVWTQNFFAFETISNTHLSAMYLYCYSLHVFVTTIVKEL